MASLQYQEITEPTVIVDGSGNIKLWYLPGALDTGHQVQNLKFPDSREFTFIPETNLEFTQQNGSSTEGRHKTFRNAQMADRHSIILGNGRSKRQLLNFHPEVSWLLKSGQEQNRTWEWVDQMSKFHALLLGTLVVIHPHMYASGWEVLI
ncbi:hypothetical protein EDD16DRAFT_1516009 [Pisolithus croceorrhizus]|nr:hypothetical protein EV401DRAFT_1895990 [Pisolithus croceorrhizus]KAI6128913.1 hypothetical protein EDD16DRAFT_1516009 [Pisolithus croceorrhizus]KAI6162392.1 hypothetical protein EDD17DRAFT_1508120 [Pisolithus thermaeus]